jgi:hypothetical protein
MTAESQQNKDYDGLCDESKCRSAGWDVSGWGYPRYDCYAESQNEQLLLCANGYEGTRIVNSEDKKEVVYGYSDDDVDIADNSGNSNMTIAKFYYTCCPKGYNNKNNNANNRHCSDPMRMQTIMLDEDSNIKNNGDENGGNLFIYTNNNNRDGNSSMPCHDDKQKYPREMTVSAFYPETYVCCDSFINETTNAIIEKDDNGEYDDGDDEDAVLGTFCDESKCISRVIANHGNYSCWGGGPGTILPFRCKDGYIGRKIDTEYTFLWTISQSNSFNLSYYTCCPPDFLSELPVKRHCSDSVTFPNTGNLTACDLASTLKYPREMKTQYNYNATNTDSYTCCDNQIDVRNETGTDYLDETECVPTCYANDLIDCIVTGNSFGHLVPMVCNNEDSLFIFPRRVKTQTIEYDYGKTKSDDFTLYECCRTKTDGPFIIDYGFKITVWPQLVVSFLALLFSAVLISGISIGMIKESRRGTGSSLRQLQGRSRRQQQQQQQGYNGYNGYNYYLILLTIPDSVLNVFLVGLYASYINQFYIFELSGYVVYAFRRDSAIIPFDYAFILGCSTANLWMNVVIAHAVFDLLKNSHQGVRVKPPTIEKVTIQGMIVYLYALIIFFAHFYLDGNGKINMDIAAPIYFMLSAGFPIIYLCYVCIIIWYRGLVPSLGGRLREISLYFFRIIVVFLVFWLPSIALMLATGPVRTRDLVQFNQEVFTKQSKLSLYPAGLLLCAIQSIVSTSMTLTKTDVRKYVIDLLTLSYCRRREEVQEDTSPNGRRREED